MKYRRWLYSQLDSWIDEGLIEAQQAARIRARYAQQEREVPWVRIIFTGIGAVLLGLGLILLFAYNWEQMHKFAKLALVFAALLGAHGMALWAQRAQKHPAVAESLHMLGTMFFGAGIWLVAQIYHIDEHYPNAFLYWGLGALALGWALPSAAQGIAACLLFAIWHGSEVFDFDVPNHGMLALVLFATVPLAWRLRSSVLLFVAIIVLYFSLISSIVIIDDEWVLTTMFALACLLLALRIIAASNDYFPDSAGVFALLGYAAYFIGLFLLIFPDVVGDIIEPDFHPITFGYLLVLSLAAVSVWCWVLYHEAISSAIPLSERLDHALIALNLVLLLLAMAVSQLPQTSSLAAVVAWFALIFFNLALLLHGAIFIVIGSRHRSPALATWGCVLIAALIVTRYMDLFDSLLLRSLAFFIIGAIVFGTGHIYSRYKPKESSA